MTENSAKKTEDGRNIPSSFFHKLCKYILDSWKLFILDSTEHGQAARKQGMFIGLLIFAILSLLASPGGAKRLFNLVLMFAGWGVILWVCCAGIQALQNFVDSKEK